MMHIATKPTIIGVLGKPLSGKDTVAYGLAEAIPCTAAISMGSVLREVKSTGPSHRFWDILHDPAEVAARGGMADDAPVFECFTKLVEENISAGITNIIWIAGPRTEDQLGWLDTWAKQRGIAENFVYVDVPDEETHRRLNGRNAGRDDDRSEILDYRLDIYNTFTKPAVDRLRREGRIVEIDGVGPVEAVSRRAVEGLHLSLRDPEITLPPMARR